MERFFQSIPGLFRSKRVKNLEIVFSFALAGRFMDKLCEFLNRTFSSNSVSPEDTTRRLQIYWDVMNVIPGPPVDSQLLADKLREHGIETSESIETGQTLARWLKNDDSRMVGYAQHRVDRVLAALPEDARGALQSYIGHLSSGQ